MTEIGMLERYQEYRTRRFLQREEQFRTWLPRWRTQRRRRLLVAALVAILVCMVAVGVICLTNMRLGPLLWLPACGAFFVVWTVLQVVSGGQGDAPRDALDEWEIQQRDSARSIGLTVTQTVTLFPAILLIVAGTLEIGIDRSLVYAAGLFVITSLIAGGCTPPMILAWTRPDPDPESDPEPDDASPDASHYDSHDDAHDH